MQLFATCKQPNRNESDLLKLSLSYDVYFNTILKDGIPVGMENNGASFILSTLKLGVTNNWNDLCYLPSHFFRAQTLTDLDLGHSHY